MRRRSKGEGRSERTERSGNKGDCSWDVLYEKIIKRQNITTSIVMKTLKTLKQHTQTLPLNQHRPISLWRTCHTLNTTMLFHLKYVNSIFNEGGRKPHVNIYL